MAGAPQTSTRAERQEGSLTARAAHLFAARIVAFVLAFALPLLLVRRMSVEEFGLYKQVFLVVGTALAVIPLGVHMSAFYYLPRELDARRRAGVVLNILLFNLVAAGAVAAALALRPELLASLFGNTALEGLAPLVAATILFWVAASALEYVALANEEARLATAFIVLSQVTKTGLLFAAALAAGSVRALVWAALAQGVLQTALMLWYLTSRFGAFWRGFSFGALRGQLAYALPFGMAGVVLQLQLDVPHYFVSNEFGAAAYAIYAVGCFNLPLVALLADSAGSVMIPRISRLQSEGRVAEIADATANVVRKLAAVYLPLYAFLIVFGREFITLLFTARYLDSWPIFAVNLTLVPLTLLTSACDPIMRAYAERRFLFLKIRLAVVAALGVVLFVATPRLGLVGVVAAVVVAAAVERIVTAAVVWRVLGLGLRDLKRFEPVARLAVASASAALVAAGARGLVVDQPPFVALAAGAAIFGVVYLAAVAALRVATPAERDMLRTRAARVRRVFGRLAAARIS